MTMTAPPREPTLDDRYCHHAWEYGQRYVGCVLHCGKPQPPRAAPAPSAEPPAQAAPDDLVRRLTGEYEGCPYPVTVARVAWLQEAVAELQRQAREIATLREFVREMDALEWSGYANMVAYKAARAKVRP